LSSELEPNDSESQANDISLGDNISGTLAASTDQDYFKFTASDHNLNTTNIDLVGLSQTGLEYDR
jgi:hypothetical protein